MQPGADLAGFRRAVRALVSARVPPEGVVWDADGSATLFGDGPADTGPPVSLPRRVAGLIEAVVCHRNPERYALLYDLVWRTIQGERELLAVASDPLVHRLALLRKAIARDLHKMHAFLRFRRIERPEGGERFVAWFEPDHFIVEAAAPFFVERFRAMRWTILTPAGSLDWDGEHLVVGPPGDHGPAPACDDFEVGWQAYYESTFNPARLNTTAMRAEMPKKYWHNMPETAAIPLLVRSARARLDGMLDKDAAVPLKRDPAKAVAAMADQAPTSLEALNRIIAGSHPMVSGGQRAVLGEGPVGAAIAFVGEQPGDQEDIVGRPFVGPAGQMLDRALQQAGIDRSRSYFTNAVKHFKFEPRGKRRIHQSPTAGEVKHYRWWLIKEIELARPAVVVALGATAVLALTGRSTPIARARGKAAFECGPGFVTVHPAYLLRLPDETARQAAYTAFLSDLRQVRDMAANRANAA